MVRFLCLWKCRSICEQSRESESESEPSFCNSQRSKTLCCYLRNCIANNCEAFKAFTFAEQDVSICLSNYSNAKPRQAKPSQILYWYDIKWIGHIWIILFVNQKVTSSQAYKELCQFHHLFTSNRLGGTTFGFSSNAARNDLLTF